MIYTDPVHTMGSHKAWLEYTFYNKYAAPFRAKY